MVLLSPVSGFIIPTIRLQLLLISYICYENMYKNICNDGKNINESFYDYKWVQTYFPGKQPSTKQLSTVCHYVCKQKMKYERQFDGPRGHQQK